ncbi:hypothetical protein ACWDNT_27820 [Streptomyces sp. NPDC000963]
MSGAGLTGTLRAFPVLEDLPGSGGFGAGFVPLLERLFISSTQV